jgi:cation diffusion facilitator family transporter
MVVAAVGLVVNIVSALILGHAHHEDHHHQEGDDHHHHDDLNLKSAYIHVIADAATSVLAIAALAGGWMFGWSWLDPVMGLIGAVLVAVWAKQLLTDTGKVLLDREMDDPVVDEIREVVEANSKAGQTRIANLHVWRVGRSSHSRALSLVTRDTTLTADKVREWLSVHKEIVHSTIELNRK